MSFFSFLSFFFKLRERERGYIKLGIMRNGLKVYLSFFFLMEFPWRIFPLLRAYRLYAIFNTGLKNWLLRVRDSFRLLLPGVLGFWFCPPRTLSNKSLSYYLFSLMGRRCHFRFRVPANRLASTFFLSVSGDPREVTEYKHLLTVIL